MSVVSRVVQLPDTFFFFFNDTATTEIYTLSLHDALPISLPAQTKLDRALDDFFLRYRWPWFPVIDATGRFLGLVSREKVRSEEHTSELQSTPISRMPSSA